MKRQPTLPVLETQSSDKLPEMPTLSQKSSEAILPPYTSRSPTRDDGSALGLDKEPTVPDLSFDPRKPAPPSRSNTQFSQASAASYGSNAPLLSSAGPMGYGPAGRSYSPAPLSMNESDQMMANQRPPMARNGTNYSVASSRSNQSAWGPPNSTQGRGMGPPIRQNTMDSDYQSQGRGTAPPIRQNTMDSDYQSQERGMGPPIRQNTMDSKYQSQGRGRGPPIRQNTMDSDYQSQGRSTPGPLTRQNTGQSSFGPQGPSGPPSRQNTGMDYYQARPNHGPGAPGPPNRQASGMSSYQDDARAGPSMQSQPTLPASNAMGPPTGQARYMPYNPNAAGSMNSSQLTSGSSRPQREFTSSPTHRNFSAPLRSARQPEYFNQRRQPPQRSGTAPLPVTTGYDDSIYDIYGDEEDDQNVRPLPPVRAATASPGTRSHINQSGYRSNASNHV
jgi:hypothetical protein